MRSCRQALDARPEVRRESGVRLLLWRDPPTFVGHAGSQLGARADPQLAVDAREVGLHRLRAYVRLARDFPVREALAASSATRRSVAVSSSGERRRPTRSSSARVCASPRRVHRAARRSRAPRAACPQRLASASCAAAGGRALSCARPSSKGSFAAASRSSSSRAASAPLTSPSAVSTRARARGSATLIQSRGNVLPRSSSRSSSARARSPSPRATSDSTWMGSLRSGRKSRTPDRVHELAHPHQGAIDLGVISGRVFDEREADRRSASHQRIRRARL